MGPVDFFNKNKLTHWLTLFLTIIVLSVTVLSALFIFPGAVQAAAWDVSTATYANKSAYVGTEDIYPHGVAFSSDGTKMYIAGNANDKVYQYTLSTAWDVSTATYANKSKAVGTEETVLLGVAFSSDGTKMYIVGIGHNTVYQYTLSTAWDVSTATYANKSKAVGTEDTSPRDVAFSSDGTKMYIMGVSTDTVYQYTLSTAWDVSTATYANKSKYVGTEDTASIGVTFNSDGTKMYIVGGSNDTVYQYTLSTAWDVSTATYANKSKAVGTQDNYPNDVAFSSDGTKMYIAGVTSITVYQYILVLPDQVTGVSATDGTYTDKVRVTWNAAEGADKYYVWNGSSWVDVGLVTTWDDTSAPAPTITPGTASASDGTSEAYVALSLSGQSANNGSSISYKVKAWNTAGYGPESTSNSGYRGVGSLTYQWQRSAGDSDASYSNISGATTASYNDTGAPADGSGRYYKCVENATGADQQISSVDRGYRIAAPAAPTIGTPTALSTTSIRWNFTDNADNETGFKIHDSAHAVKATCGPKTAEDPTQTGSHYCDETGLSANTQYTRHVHAYNAAGDSTGSANASRYTWPNPPTGQTASGDWDSVQGYHVDVSWAAGTGGADHYHVRSSSDSYATVKYNASATSYTETGLSANTAYTYRIYAVNADDVENTSYVSATDTTPPAEGEMTLKGVILKGLNIR